MNISSLWKYKVTSSGENAIAQQCFCQDTVPNFPPLIKSAMEYEMHVSGSVGGSVGAWLFAWSLFWPCRVSCCLSAVLMEKHWHKHKKTNQLVLLADFFFSSPFFFFSMFCQIIKQSPLKKKPLLGETLQRKLCDIQQVRYWVCRACLALLSNVEREMALLGCQHQCSASHCGWRLPAQPETNGLSMGDQTTPQQTLNYTFIYHNSGWVLIISWT